MNSWEDPKFVEAVKATGRKKLVMAVLWTESLPEFSDINGDWKQAMKVYIVTMHPAVRQ